LSSQAYEPIRKLAGSDAVESFDCGQSALNQFLQRFAFVNQKSNSAQTYVSCQSGSVVGFYSLAVGSVEPSNAAPRVTKGIPQHPVPVMILARLAVDLQHQGAGLGKALLKMRCCAQRRRRILLGFVHCWFTPRTSLPGSGISIGSLNPAHLTRFTCSF
jgi:GNAT superfamily N-acetyltransferase